LGYQHREHVLTTGRAKLCNCLSRGLPRKKGVTNGNEPRRARRNRRNRTIIRTGLSPLTTRPRGGFFFKRLIPQPKRHVPPSQARSIPAAEQTRQAGPIGHIGSERNSRQPITVHFNDTKNSETKQLFLLMKTELY
jgi:hypothetical protein